MGSRSPAGRYRGSLEVESKIAKGVLHVESANCGCVAPGNYRDVGLIAILTLNMD